MGQGDCSVPASQCGLLRESGKQGRHLVQVLTCCLNGLGGDDGRFI
jgi:hypothetical protein